MNIVFFGSSKYIIPVIEILHKNFNLFVVTTEKLPTDPVISYCIKHKVYYYVVIDFGKNNEIVKRIKKENAKVGVLASFGAIIPEQILESFPKGILNIHPSLLPNYRGPTPAQAAILNGSGKTGVTIIKLDNQIDHGSILAQKEEPILKSDTAETLYQRLFKIGADLLNKNIKEYIDGKIKLKEQDHSMATFTKSLTRKDGFFDIDNPPPPEILDRMIRAYYPWPNAWGELRIRNKELRIKLLPDKMIQIEGGKPMSLKDFLNGYPEVKDKILQILKII